MLAKHIALHSVLSMELLKQAVGGNGYKLIALKPLVSEGSG